MLDDLDELNEVNWKDGFAGAGVGALNRGG